MKISHLLLPLSKEIPKDAETISHQLMLRAGLIKKVAAGIYDYLPVGYRVIRKFEQIVRDEMNAAGGQEILMPAVIPAALWQETDRWEKYGHLLLRIKDRSGNDFCFGPTHEEVVTDLIKSTIQSYRQLPLMVYQIQTKFRDEIRPRFGLMRAREFGMKDAYSFHPSPECLTETYTKMQTVYHKIFSRCGLNAVMVNATSGDIGGSVSAEFMITAESGEDAIGTCQNCGYAANQEVLDIHGACPTCSAKITVTRGIEVGHIFQLGTLYSQKMNATFLTENGQASPFVMGCYGIGIGRTVAAAIEQHHDNRGIIWPMALAPFSIIIIIIGNNPDLITTATALYDRCCQAGIEILIDDRDESAGVKFASADLIGIPFQVIIGKRTTTDQVVEIKHRATQKVEFISVDSAFTTLCQYVHRDS